MGQTLSGLNTSSNNNKLQSFNAIDKNTETKVQNISSNDEFHHRNIHSGIRSRLYELKKPDLTDSDRDNRVDLILSDFDKLIKDMKDTPDCEFHRSVFDSIKILEKKLEETTCKLPNNDKQQKGGRRHKSKKTPKNIQTKKKGYDTTKKKTKKEKVHSIPPNNV